MRVIRILMAGSPRCAWRRCRAPGKRGRTPGGRMADWEPPSERGRDDASSHLYRRRMRCKQKSAQPAWPHGNEVLFPTKNKNISFRSRSWQDTGQLSEDLTYSDQPDITVTDSRGFSPHSTCKHEACANYPIFNCCYYSTKSHKYKYHFPVYYVDFYIASSENRNKL